MIDRSINNIDIKRINKNKIFNLIYKRKKISKKEIADSLKLSLPTVNQNLKTLANIGLIRTLGAFESTGGRKAKVISCVEEAKYSIGLDITKKYISLVLINLRGDILHNSHFKRSYSHSNEYYQYLGDLVSDFIVDNKIEKEKILGIGISIPGILDKLRKKILYSSHALGISQVNCSDFSKYIPYNCIFSNDANAAAFAEMCVNNNIKNVVYLSLNYTVGGAIILNNGIFLGSNQRSGEFGHMTIVPNGKMCYCSKAGCLNAYCSAAYLSNLADGSLSSFFKNLESGKGDYQLIWDEYLSHLAIAINNLRMIFDGIVIAGGTVVSYLDKYAVKLKKILLRLNTFESNPNYLQICKYKFESSAVGAALELVRYCQMLWMRNYTSSRRSLCSHLLY